VARARSLTPPSCKPHAESETGDKLDPGRHSCFGHDHPGNQGECGDYEDGAIDKIERCRRRKPTAVASVSQLRVKLAMMRPPTKLISMSSVATPSRLPTSAVEAIPTDSRWTSRLPRSNSASVPSMGRLRQFSLGKDLASYRANENHKECKIENSRGIGTDSCGNQHGNSSNRPEQHEEGERAALEWHAACPVWYGRQQETRDRCGTEAENHLMHMPRACLWAVARDCSHDGAGSYLPQFLVLSRV
jgi:hypothetical protein